MFNIFFIVFNIFLLCQYFWKVLVNKTLRLCVTDIEKCNISGGIYNPIPKVKTLTQDLLLCAPSPAPAPAPALIADFLNSASN